MAGLKAKPRFEVGDEHNEFTIVEYKGFEKQGNVQRQQRRTTCYINYFNHEYLL